LHVCTSQVFARLKGLHVSSVRFQICLQGYALAECLRLDGSICAAAEGLCVCLGQASCVQARSLMSALRHRTDTAPTYTCAACLVQCARWHATRRATRAIGALTAKNLFTLTDASGNGTPTTLVSPHLLSAGALDCLLHCNTRVAQPRATSRNLAQPHATSCCKTPGCMAPHRDLLEAHSLLVAHRLLAGDC